MTGTDKVGRWDRRQALVGLGASSFSAALPQPAFSANDQTLGARAARAGLMFGTCIEQEVYEDPVYAALVREQCTIAVNANAFKFDWLRPTGRQADFSGAERLLDFAEDASLPFRGHALVWNDWVPDWVKALSKSEVETLLDAHIDEVVIRYSGRMQSWDVVNEPFAPWDNQPGQYRKGAWYDALGPGYIERAFRRAAAADPKARLVLNEAFCERDDDLGRTVRPALLDLVKRLKDADVPLHVVGLQAHLQPQFAFDDAVYARFLESLAAEGVDIYLTELDVDDSSLSADLNERDAGVARRYADFLTAALSVAAVKAVIAWGLSDKYTWYRDLARTAGTLKQRPPRPLAYDPAFAPKWAWIAIAEAFDARAKSVVR